MTNMTLINMTTEGRSKNGLQAQHELFRSATGKTIIPLLAFKLTDVGNDNRTAAYTGGSVVL